MTLKEAIRNYKEAAKQSEMMKRDEDLHRLNEIEDDLGYVKLQNKRYPLAMMTTTCKAQIIKAIAEIIPQYKKLNPTQIIYKDEIFNKVLRLAEKIA
ncbi:hypothetical protein [Sporolactobacillus terrae]|uniref:hypothetical protein n=1 Tax=Sporolactobacillus terrae TaxID=269673 RepID=UPI00048C1FFE|nr:hypothetical protein [Sporolactobacillus terrae]